MFLKAKRDERSRDTRNRFEQWAHNPTCQANTISAVHNVRMADVAKAENYPPTFGQSPFAIQRGNTFERTLFRNNAAILLEALSEKDVLPEDASGLKDLRLTLNGGKLRTLDEAIEQTRQLILEVSQASAATRRRLPAVVAAATVRIPRGVMLPEAILILDVLAIRTDGPVPELIVGEVKTYPDRGGHTDPRSLALARAQAGVYLHALDLLVAELGVGQRMRVSRTGFLVLTKPGSNSPAVRTGEDLRYQAERAQRGFELLERAAAELPTMRAGEPLEQAALIQAVIAAETSYEETCVSFCDRANCCRDRALASGDPIVLGLDVQRFVGGTDLARLGELLDGARARNDAERDLMRRIAESEQLAEP